MTNSLYDVCIVVGLGHVGLTNAITNIRKKIRRVEMDPFVFTSGSTSISTTQYKDL